MYKRQGIDKAIHYSEDLRKASTELTNQYKEEQESLDDSRQSYDCLLYTSFTVVKMELMVDIRHIEMQFRH